MDLEERKILNSSTGPSNCKHRRGPFDLLVPRLEAHISRIFPRKSIEEAGWGNVEVVLGDASAKDGNDRSISEGDRQVFTRWTPDNLLWSPTHFHLPHSRLAQISNRKGLFGR